METKKAELSCEGQSAAQTLELPSEKFYLTAK